MSLTSLFFAYIFGGLTFIPLLLAAVLIPGWLLLPRIADSAYGHEHGSIDEVLSDGPDGEVAKGSLRVAEENTYAPEGAASATFAVLRAFSFQAANEALIAREKSNAAAMGVNGAVDGSACLLYTSPSPRDGLLSRMPSSA